jgi:phosphoribosylglycinamide formyltransferase 2
VVFDGVADALRIPQTDIRLFGKPQSFVRRRMGVEVARARAKACAGTVTVRAV